MNQSEVISRREGWLNAWIDDDLVMMHAESSVHLTLSGAGGRIWELLERPYSVGELCDVLAREFEITPDAARPEVLSFLDQLLQREAIDVHPVDVA